MHVAGAGSVVCAVVAAVATEFLVVCFALWGVVCFGGCMLPALYGFNINIFPQQLAFNSAMLRFT